MALRRTLQPYFGKASAALVAQANQASKLLNVPGITFEQKEKLLARVGELLKACDDLMRKRRIRSLALQAKRYSR